MIEFGEFQKIELKIGRIEKAEDLPGKDKLYKLTVSLGEEKPRTLVAGIKEFYPAAELKGKQIVVVANLKPAKIAGIESNGMLLAVKGRDGKYTLLVPDKGAQTGARVE